MSSDSSRTIVVGDVHGCLDELDELVRMLELGPRDRLVMVGDLLDRGPDPVGVVRRVRALGALSVLGNHEEKHLRFRRHELRRVSEPGYRNPMKPFTDARSAEHRALSADDWRWLESLPPWKRIDRGWVVVHAGLEPRWALDRQKPQIVMRIRDVDDRGQFVGNADPRVPAPGSVPWATRWPGPERVIYGHHVHGLGAPRVDRPASGVECWGIDTGCVFGGHLSALVLPTLEVVQVRARREYLPLDREVLD